MPKKELTQVHDSLAALFSVFAGEFDPQQFFADNSQFDLMKLGVQLGRDGEITLARVQEYVEASWDVSEDDAMTYAAKLFRMLQQLAEECELPFSVEPVKKKRKPRKKKTGVRKTKKKKARRGRPPGGAKKKSSKSPRKQELIDAFGSEAKARNALVKEMEKEAKVKKHGFMKRAIANLAEAHDLKALKAIKPHQVAELRKSFGIDPTFTRG